MRKAKLKMSRAAERAIASSIARNDARRKLEDVELLSAARLNLDPLEYGQLRARIDGCIEKLAVEGASTLLKHYRGKG